MVRTFSVGEISRQPTLWDIPYDDHPHLPIARQIQDIKGMFSLQVADITILQIADVICQLVLLLF